MAKISKRMRMKSTLLTNCQIKTDEQQDPRTKSRLRFRICLKEPGRAHQNSIKNRRTCRTRKMTKLIAVMFKINTRINAFKVNQRAAARCHSIWSSTKVILAKKTVLKRSQSPGTWSRACESRPRISRRNRRIITTFWNCFHLIHQLQQRGHFKEVLNVKKLTIRINFTSDKNCSSAKTRYQIVKGVKCSRKSWSPFSKQIGHYPTTTYSDKTGKHYLQISLALKNKWRKQMINSWGITV